jgi:hypothetical protein
MQRQRTGCCYHRVEVNDAIAEVLHGKARGRIVLEP